MDERAAIRTGGSGCFLLLFGLPFAGMGVVFLAFLLTDPASVTINDRPGTVADAWLPLVFIAIGLGLAGIHWSTHLESEPRRLVRRRGWLLFTTTSTTDLATASAVTIDQQVRGSGKNRRTAYPVAVVTAEGDEELQAPASPRRARALGERVARLLQLPMTDRRDGSTRLPDELDVPLAERLAAADCDPGPLPADGRLTWQEGASGIELSVAGNPLAGLLPLLGILPLVVIGGLFWWFAWRPAASDAPAFFRYAPLLLGVVPAVVVLAVMARTGLGRRRLSVDPQGVRVGWRHIATSDIEEIVLHQKPVFGWRVVLVGDRGERTAATGLDQATARALKALIGAGLTGRRPG